MDSGDLVGADAVFVDYGAPREVGDRYDMVGVLHAIFLDAEHRRVNVAAGAVESVACTWVTSGLPVTFFACMPAGYVSQSCGVYHVAWNGARDHSGHNRVIVDFLDDVVWVSAGGIRCIPGSLRRI